MALTPPPPPLVAPALADDWPAPSQSIPPADALDLSGPPAVSRPALPSSAASVRGASGFAAADLSRAPDSLLSARKGESASFTFQREAGGKALRMKLSLKSTAGEACSYLSAYIIPVRTDLMGQLSGWYRLEQDGQRVPASAALETVDPQKPLVIRFVSNISSFADIAVIGGPAPVRFVAPIGTAVPVATLVDHLTAWLGLPDGRWRLHLGGRARSPRHPGRRAGRGPLPSHPQGRRRRRVRLR